MRSEYTERKKDRKYETEKNIIDSFACRMYVYAYSVLIRRR